MDAPSSKNVPISYYLMQLAPDSCYRDPCTLASLPPSSLEVRDPFRSLWAIEGEEKRELAGCCYLLGGRAKGRAAQVEFSQLTFRLANISVVITIEGSIPSRYLGQMMIEDDDDEREIEKRG